jgi:hypothetical protein
VEGHPDFYGHYVIEQARYEQDEWYADPMAALKDEDPQETWEAAEAEQDRRQEIANLHEYGNAALIAAAPALYQACKALLDTIDGGGGAYWKIGFDEIEAIRKALAQAEDLTQGGIFQVPNFTLTPKAS